MADEIKVGKAYLTRTRGKLVVIRVDEITLDATGNTAYIATNLSKPGNRMILSNINIVKGGGR